MSQIAGKQLPRVNRAALVPLAVFLIALLVRSIGIGWGLANPLHHHSYHPDEEVNWVVSQLVEPAKLQFDPKFYSYGTLYFTTLGVASDMVASYGAGPGTADVERFYRYVAACEQAGRWINAVAGSATALLVFLMLRRRTTEFGAAAGAAFIAFAPGHVVHSRFETVDVFATFLLAASAFYALRLIPGDGDGEEISAKLGLKFAVFSGLFAGLSCGTKYTGILGLLTLYAALALVERPNKLRDAALGTLASIGAFLISTPGVFLNWPKFSHDFAFEMHHAAQGHGIVFAHTSNGFLYHISNLFVGIGGLLTVLAAAGLGWAAWQRRTWAIALLAFFVPYYVLIGRSEVKFLRYTLPMYVGLACGFGWLMGEANRRKGWHRGLVALGIFGVGGLDFGGLRATALFTQAMATEEPRDAAATYLKKQAAGNPNVVVGLVDDPWFYTPPLYPDTGMNRTGNYNSMALPMVAATEPRVIRYCPANPADRFDWDVRLLDQSPDYVVYTNLEVDDLDRLSRASNRTGEEQLQVDRFNAFTARLERDYQMVERFGHSETMVQDMQYVMPVVYVWQRKAR